jgi:hypothetical protein
MKGRLTALRVWRFCLGLRYRPGPDGMQARARAKETGLFRRDMGLRRN